MIYASKDIEESDKVKRIKNIIQTLRAAAGGGAFICSIAGARVDGQAGELVFINEPEVGKETTVLHEIIHMCNDCSGFEDLLWLLWKVDNNERRRIVKAVLSALIAVAMTGMKEEPDKTKLSTLN